MTRRPKTQRQERREREEPLQGVFSQGYEARAELFLISANPWTADPRMAEAWNMGWRKRDREIAQQPGGAPRLPYRNRIP